MSNTDYLINFSGGQKIKASETNSNNQYILNQIEKRGTAIEAYIKTEMDSFKDIVTSGSMKTGDCKIAFYDTVPDKFLVANGASLLITEYQELYDVIGSQYGQEDDYHFNIPDMRNRIPEGFKDATEAFGSFQEGVVPNIKGYIGSPYLNATGAFYYGNRYGGNSSGGNGFNETYFNASRASKCYKDGVTRVSVDRVKVNYLIKYED